MRLIVVREQERVQQRLVEKLLQVAQVPRIGGRDVLRHLYLESVIAVLRLDKQINFLSIVGTQIIKINTSANVVHLFVYLRYNGTLELAARQSATLFQNRLNHAIV